jgi:nucleoside-diphosphate-sugar epimerase
MTKTSNGLKFTDADELIVALAASVAGAGSGFNTAAVTSVNDQATSTTLIAANTLAKERIIYNDSSSIMYIKFGITASATDYTAKLFPDDIIITKYTGRIDVVWSADSSGAAKVTELT